MERPRLWRAGAAVLALAAAVSLSCDEHSRYLTNEPPEHQWGTFGEEVYRMVHDSAEASSSDGDGPAAVLEQRREAVVEAADLTLPPSLYDPARQSLASTLDRIDDGTMPRLTRSTTTLLTDLSDDRPTLDAALDLRDQPWCVSQGEVNDLLRHLGLAHDRDGQPLLVPLTASGLRLAREHDGRDDQGQLTSDEPVELRELSRALARDLEEVDLDELDEALSFDSSLIERLIAAVGLPDEGEPVWVVQADHRGQPRVATDPNTGAVYAPFVDGDGDGLADEGPIGQLLNSAADPATIAIYGRTRQHSADGRALAYDGRPLYVYVDVRRSGLGVVVRALRQMMIDDVHDDLVHHVDTLLSPRTPAFDERDDSYYEAFPAGRTESLEPGFDLTWALIEASRERPPDRLLYGVEELLRTHRGEVRTLLEQAMLAADEVAVVDPEPALREHNTLLDDLILEDEPPGAVCYGTYDGDLNHHCSGVPGPLLPRLIETGILRDLVDLLDAPELEAMDEVMVELMTHRDNPIRPTATELRQSVLASGESVDNRSVMQRMLHLVHDANGASFTTTLTDLIDWRIENMAIFFLESYCAGGEEMVPSAALWVLSDYFETVRPTPAEIAQFMAVDHSGQFAVWANPRGREGHDLYNYNADTLLALEFTGMNEVMRPIAQLFCERDELLLLANLFSVLHEHYSTLPAYTIDMSRRFDFYTVERPAGVRAYEQAIVRALTGSDVLDAARRVGSVAATVTVEGEPIIDDAIDLVDHLIDSDAGVRLRLHDDPDRDQIYRFDRLTPMPHPTHLNVVYQRAVEANEAWNAEDEAVREELTAIFDLLAEYYLDWPGEDAMRRDQAEYMVSLAERAMPVLADWSRENLDRGTWEEEIADARTTIDDLEQQLSDISQDPLLPAALDVVLLLLDDPETGPLLRELALYFLDPADAEASGFRDPFTAVARIVVALIQSLPEAQSYEQIARYVATLLDPETTPFGSLPGDVALLTGASVDSVALQSAANALAPGVPSDSDHAPPLVVIAEALTEMGRIEPGADEPLDADDLSEMSRDAVYLLDDTSHGLERIYSIVGARASEEE